MRSAAALAIDELSTVLGGAASFVVMRSDGDCALAIGPSARSLLSGAAASGRRYQREGEWARLVLPVDVAPPYTAAVGIERIGRALTRRDERLLHSAAFTLARGFERCQPPRWRSRAPRALEASSRLSSSMSPGPRASPRTSR
jgi:hypothetical protein